MESELSAHTERPLGEEEGRVRSWFIVLITFTSTTGEKTENSHMYCSMEGFDHNGIVIGITNHY